MKNLLFLSKIAVDPIPTMKKLVEYNADLCIKIIGKTSKGVLNQQLNDSKDDSIIPKFMKQATNHGRKIYLWQELSINVGGSSLSKAAISRLNRYVGKYPSFGGFVFMADNNCKISKAEAVTYYTAIRNKFPSIKIYMVCPSEVISDGVSYLASVVNKIIVNVGSLPTWDEYRKSYLNYYNISVNKDIVPFFGIDAMSNFGYKYNANKLKEFYKSLMLDNCDGCGIWQWDVIYKADKIMNYLVWTRKDSTVTEDPVIIPVEEEEEEDNEFTQERWELVWKYIKKEMGLE